MKKVLIMMVLAVAGWLGKTSAQTPAVVWSEKSGWHKIGEKMVDLKMEKDEILVMGADKFASLKFKVVDASIEILSAEVIFEAGDKQSIPVNTPLTAGTETRIYELTGGDREIKKISFRYKTLPNVKDKRARVEIWGFKSAEKPKETKPEL